jgi:hypothetical protein
MKFDTIFDFKRSSLTNYGMKFSQPDIVNLQLFYG